MPYAIEPSSEVYHRDDIPMLCCWRKLYRCVEVGVDRGEWAALFLDRFPQCHQWWGIDAYEPYPEMPFDRTSDYNMAVARLIPHARRAKLLKAPSVAAAKYFKPASIDFIYIDAAHDYESVRADIAAWFPVLSAQGLLAGHDWTDQPVHQGVKRAVKEFAREHGHTIYVTTVEGYHQEECPSWLIYKSGMPGAEWRRC